MGTTFRPKFVYLATCTLRVSERLHLHMETWNPKLSLLPPSVRVAKQSIAATDDPAVDLNYHESSWRQSCYWYSSLLRFCRLAHYVLAQTDALQFQTSGVVLSRENRISLESALLSAWFVKVLR